MAIFDIPLKVKLSLRLGKKEPNFEGFTVVERNKQYFAEREVMLSFRLHKEIAELCGMVSTTAARMGYIGPLESAGYADSHTNLSRTGVLRMREVIVNDQRTGVMFGSRDLGRQEWNTRLHAFQLRIDRNGAAIHAKYEVVVSEDDAWKLREGMRFMTNKYRELPDEWTTWDLFSGSVLDPMSDKYNFAHISVENDGMISFTENSKKGNADIQKRMKPGKFLKEFFGERMNAYYGENKANAKIAEMAAQFGNHVKTEELLFAKTPEEIEWVYTHGPSSCMSHERGDYDTRDDMHPVGIFGAGDLEVAYIKRGGRVTARALVWPEKKIWTRIYGDHTRIEGLLKAQGYKAGGTFCLDGAKMLLKRNDRRWNGGFVAPYVDGQAWARIDGDNLVIDHNKGYIHLLNTCGTAEPGATCKECSKMWRSMEMQTWRAAPGEREKMTCSPCWEKGTWMCKLLGERHGNGYKKMVMANGDIWSEQAFKLYGFTCGYDKQNYPNDPSRWDRRSNTYEQRVAMWDGSYWLLKNFNEHGKHYEGKNYSQDAYERQILKDMGQSDLPLAEAAYAKVLQERREQAQKEYALRLERMKKEREDAEKRKRDLDNKRRRDMRALRKAVAARGVTLSNNWTERCQNYIYYPEVGRYFYSSETQAPITTAPAAASARTGYVAFAQTATEWAYDALTGSWTQRRSR